MCVSFLNHSLPQNWLFRQVVGLNQDFYRDGISRIEKPIAADALVGRFETIGVRFLEVLDDSTFVEVEYRRVVEKFKQVSCSSIDC